MLLADRQGTIVVLTSRSVDEILAQQRQIVTAAVDLSDIAHLLGAQIEGTLSFARNTQDLRP